MEHNKEYTRFITHSVSSRKEYFMLSVVKEEKEYRNEYYFKIGGIGVQSDATCETLGDVLPTFEEHVQVSDGRRTDREIEKGTKMTRSHYNRARNFIANETEEHSKDMTPVEWLKQAKK